MKTITLLILFGSLFNQAYGQIITIKQDSSQFLYTKKIKNTTAVIDLKSSLVIEQSKRTFPTTYKIVKGGISYYSNDLFVFEKLRTVKFSCLDTNGKTVWYTFRFNGLKIYESK